MSGSIAKIELKPLMSNTSRTEADNPDRMRWRWVARAVFAPFSNTRSPAELTPSARSALDQRSISARSALDGSVPLGREGDRGGARGTGLGLGQGAVGRPEAQRERQ